MLNISLKRINDRVDISKYQSFEMLSKKSVSDKLIKILLAILVIVVIALFLPWTQNIRAKGYVTTLTPESRPQTVQALIGGKIVQWFVREGDVVQVGDTIIQISEIKEEYLDPQILERTSSQINAKSESVKAYNAKADNLEDQYRALINAKDVKLQQNEIKLTQTRLKLQSDSMDLEAARVKQDIAQKQLDRIQELYNDGLKSLTDLETKKLSLQESRAKVVALENKVGAVRNELMNLEANKNAIINEYNDKIAKSRSDMMTALSDGYNAEASVNKLQSQYNAYAERQKNYFITSPISGMVTKAMQSGIGEMIKNGDKIVSIMPADYELAIEMYVAARDVPLLNKGQKVRVQFDGWPAIVFSGWPNSSYGTFGGRIFAIDNFISDNGKYRVLVSPDPGEIPWPEEVRVGGGANTITLLNDVKIGYEIWRQLNGFPPDYYGKPQSEEVKIKAPLRKVK